MELPCRAEIEYEQEAARLGAAVRTQALPPETARFQLHVFADYQVRRLLSLNRFAGIRIWPAAELRRQFPTRFRHHELPPGTPDATAFDAADILADRLVIERKHVPAPYSLARIPYAERRRFPGYTPGLFEFSLFDGKRTLLDVVRIADYRFCR